MSSVMEMKVSMKKGVGFYIRAASSFLKGIEAKEATEGKEAVEAKAPVDELKISGLGEAINTAVTAASRAEADGFGTITKVETAYPDMNNGRGCAQIFITVKRKA
uniref:DNA/RNA-binding protein Alba-like domain-containing protein n=1 Tax=Alexandrium monilatum TaxID=311494 RepID=A0A7S4SM03_9DINO|mmetsp:Transcript_15476/g.48656  ORF Transcript_15476/g.48656 Transcript_15476/m.48656 type:complete len:105 (+) Transcript_15476:97-411(+)